jgi:hypothetical protein
MLVSRGPAAAAEAGDKLLTGLALRLWRHALVEGPAEALPVTLSELRTDDRSDAAASIVWCSAAALASVSRPFVRLIGLNAGRWPRRISEDRLIPDHIVPLEELDPLPVAEADRRDFATIEATTTRSVTVSYSRRDAEGRLLGQSPLISGMAETSRARPRPRARGERSRPPARPPRRICEHPERGVRWGVVTDPFEFSRRPRPRGGPGGLPAKRDRGRIGTNRARLYGLIDGTLGSPEP